MGRLVMLKVIFVSSEIMSQEASASISITTIATVPWKTAPILMSAPSVEMVSTPVTYANHNWVGDEVIEIGGSIRQVKHTI